MLVIVELTAKSLLLQLLSAAGGRPLPVRSALVAAELFGISENNVRVALARMSAEGLIESAARGEYRLAARAEELAREVAGWRDAEDRTTRWSGAYLAVFSGALGRADKRALRQRSRAFSMLGFVELERGLQVRPDNLRGGVEGVRRRLIALGLEPEALVYRADGFEVEVESRIRASWNGAALTTSYVQTRRKLERWLERAPCLELEVAARESFLLGSRAIRQIVYDPLLPAPFVDVAERRAFIAAMKAMDGEGRRIWLEFFHFAGAAHSARAAVH